MTRTLALVPLDERPACSDLPRRIAEVAGARALLPPPAALPRVRVPGDPGALAGWLEATLRRGRCDAAVVALETLGFGGLIASRTVPASVEEVTARWARLRGAGVPVHAVTLVTRTPDSADAMEEPEYWSPYGPALHRLSAALHRAAAGAPTPDIPDIPDAVRRDFLHRRLRNHTLNLAALGLLADGTLETLVVGADDTAEWGLATAELGRLREWADRLGEPGVSVRPGADEATATLVARVLSGGVPVRFAVEAAGSLDRVAPYENMPVGQTALGQIAACGGVCVSVTEGVRPGGASPGTSGGGSGGPGHGGPGSPWVPGASRITGSLEGGPAGEAEVTLLIHVPDGTGADWAVAPPAGPAPDDGSAAALAGRAAELLAAGRRVAVADCAQPNGADPALVAALAERGLLPRLTAYAGWNTAGNTLGTVTAHAVAVVAGWRTGGFDAAAHRRLLFRRLVEDHGYMTRVRGEARTRLGSDPARHDHVPPGHPVIAEIEAGLNALRPPGFGGLAVTGVRLPWDRTFEVDFGIEDAGETEEDGA